MKAREKSEIIRADELLSEAVALRLKSESMAQDAKLLAQAVELSFLRATLRDVLDGDKGAEKRAREYLRGTEHDRR
jgi:hypothetical protein